MRSNSFKFDLIYRTSTGECVGNSETNSIPPLKEVVEHRYTFSPCPPRIGAVPIQSHIFMHSFLHPGDHTGAVAIHQLPKKVGGKLSCIGQPINHCELPYGWGIYIVEGIDQPLVALSLAFVLLFVFLVASCRSVLNTDVQGGMAIGQFALALVALAFSTVAVATGTLQKLL